MKNSDLIIASMTFVLVIMLFCIVGKSDAVNSYLEGEDFASVSDAGEFVLHPPSIDEIPLATVLLQFEENDRLVEELKKKDISTKVELQSGEIYVKENGEVAGWVKADPEIAIELSQKAKFDKLLATSKTPSKKKAVYTRPAKMQTKSRYGNTAGRKASSARNRFSSRQRSSSFRKPNWLQSLSQTLDRSHRQNHEYSLRRQRKQYPNTQ